MILESVEYRQKMAVKEGHNFCEKLCLIRDDALQKSSRMISFFLDFVSPSLLRQEYQKNQRQSKCQSRRGRIASKIRAETSVTICRWSI